MQILESRVPGGTHGTAAVVKVPHPQPVVSRPAETGSGSSSSFEFPPGGFPPLEFPVFRRGFEMKIKPAVARESRDQEMNGAVNPSLAAQRPVSRGPIPTPQEKAAVSREILKV